MTDCLRLKKSNCKNCYKCIRNCPVKSIRFSEGQANIINEECILCGRCTVVCPQHAKEFVYELKNVQRMVSECDEVYVSLAPSFIANYPGCGIESLRAAIRKLGFADVEETAIGATQVKREYERLIREKHQDILITSCCHSVNLLIQKHFPDTLPYLANVLSPMQAHCQDLKKRHPGAKTVFIGPCISKKDEAQRYPGIVDAVLTYDELSHWFEKAGITPEPFTSSNPESRARFFPTTGGVIKTMLERDPEYTYISVDGVENCMEVLRDIESGDIHKCVIEMSACVGSCIAGPAMEKENRLPVQDYITVHHYAGKSDFVTDQPVSSALEKKFAPIEKRLHTPTEAEIRSVMKKMGKQTPADELNCGSCGYNSCREKAIAVCQGKAETSMCLPMLMNQAKSLSDTIVMHHPAGIVLVNDDLEIVQMNPAGCTLFNLNSPSEALGHMISDFMDPTVYVDTMATHEPTNNTILRLEEYGRIIHMSTVYDEENALTIAMMLDTTEADTIREKKEALSRSTAEIADHVVEKQMRIVQEIALLLGETTAETKVALTKLKEAVTDE